MMIHLLGVNKEGIELHLHYNRYVLFILKMLTIFILLNIADTQKYLYCVVIIYDAVSYHVKDGYYS